MASSILNTSSYLGNVVFESNHGIDLVVSICLSMRYDHQLEFRLLVYKSLRYSHINYNRLNGVIRVKISGSIYV